MNFKEFYLYEKSTKKIYLDLDGVLCNFNKQFDKYILGKTPFIDPHEYEKHVGTKKFWEQIQSLGEKFWSEMEWMPDGKELWNYLKKHDVTILTSHAPFKESVNGKKTWIKKNLGNVPYIIEKEKQKYANENSVLVDDTPKKINKWIAKKGIGVLHKNTKDSIRQLKNLGI